MSGLLALLDDVAAITKLATSKLDDISAQAMKTSSKAAGVVIDDAAVTPKYVTGLPARRELPIIWKIARASLINKLLILLPIALLLDQFAPWLLTPLLMIGGAYLCFEGAEKIIHVIFGSDLAKQSDTRAIKNAGHLEERRVKGAIKTDFILSAEIMAIALSTIEGDIWWQKAIILAVVAVFITVSVYGVVTLLVRADDWGLWVRQNARFSFTRSIGAGVVAGVPYVLKALSIIGTAAMLWVGGNILVHGSYLLGWTEPETIIKSAAASAAGWTPGLPGLVNWLVIAALDAVIGLLVGGILALVLGLFQNSDAKIPATAVTR